MFDASHMIDREDSLIDEDGDGHEDGGMCIRTFKVNSVKFDK